MCDRFGTIYHAVGTSKVPVWNNVSMEEEQCVLLISLMTFIKSTAAVSLHMLAVSILKCIFLFSHALI